jgi:hypothetical protein
MREGHFIGLNDRTTCGSKVLDGDTRIMMYGIAHPAMVIESPVEKTGRPIGSSVASRT